MNNKTTNIKKCCTIIKVVCDAKYTDSNGNELLGNVWIMSDETVRFYDYAGIGFTKIQPNEYSCDCGEGNCVCTYDDTALLEMISNLQSQIDAWNDTDISNVEFSFDNTTNTLTIDITENGTTLTSNIVLPLEEDVIVQSTSWDGISAQATITLTDGTVFNLDLSSLRDQIISSDGSVSITASLNAIGGFIFDLSVPQNTPTINRQFEKVPDVVGFANVNADGTLAYGTTGVTSSLASTGVYNLTPPTGAISCQITVLETATRDSIEAHPIDFVGSSLQIHEGDNGAGANVLRDRAFTITWFGIKIRLNDISSPDNSITIN